MSTSRLRGGVGCERSGWRAGGGRWVGGGWATRSRAADGATRALRKAGAPGGPALRKLGPRRSGKRGFGGKSEASVRHATAAEAPATHWAGRQKARAALASATRLMSESDRASFAAYDVEFVVEISRCRAPLHRSTTHAVRHAVDVELYSSTALYSSTSLQLCSALHSTSSTPSLRTRVAGLARQRRCILE